MYIHFPLFIVVCNLLSLAPLQLHFIYLIERNRI